MGLLLFLVYTGDVPEGMRFNAKLFADDTLPFSTITVIPSTNFSEDLFKITQWAYQSKVSFNPDITK